LFLYLPDACVNGTRKIETRCTMENDGECGYRVVPRIQLETGVNVWNNQAVSFFVDRMSHKNIGFSCVQNDGIDHTVIRYHLTLILVNDNQHLRFILESALISAREFGSCNEVGINDGDQLQVVKSPATED